MGIETATYVNDLDNSQPFSTDFRSQGDDHLRLLKTVLKNSLKRVTRAFYVPGFSSILTNNYTVQATDDNNTIQLDTTGGAITVTLPLLASTDAGWTCTFMKILGLNPYFISPPVGTLVSGEVAGLTKTRRCIAGARTRAYWSGSIWFVDRVIPLPIGTVLDCPTSVLPTGYEYANGQTLSSGNYPDYVTYTGSGVTPDRRGRIAVGRDNMGGSAAGLITSAGSGVDGVTLGAVGGTETITLITANLPPYTPAGTVGVASGTITGSSTPINSNSAGVGNSATLSGSSSNAVGAQQTPGITINDTRAWSFSGTAQGGTSTPVRNMPPSMVTNFIVVVE